jgi:hypothetical protein
MHPSGGCGPPLVSRGRKHPALCDHRSAPMSVSAVPDGHQATCLICGTLGPVGESSEAARSSLLRSDQYERN